MRVANPSTADNYFHLLRRQGLLSELRPLIVFTPKSLLRSKRRRVPARGPGERRVPADHRRPPGRRPARQGHPPPAVLRQGLLRPRRRRGARGRDRRRDRTPRAALPPPRGQAQGAVRLVPEPDRGDVGAGGAAQHGRLDVRAAAPRALLPANGTLYYVGRSARSSPAEGYPQTHKRRAAADRHRGVLHRAPTASPRKAGRDSPPRRCARGSRASSALGPGRPGDRDLVERRRPTRWCSAAAHGSLLTRPHATRRAWPSSAAGPAAARCCGDRTSSRSTCSSRRRTPVHRRRRRLVPLAGRGARRRARGARRLRRGRPAARGAAAERPGRGRAGVLRRVLAVGGAGRRPQGGGPLAGAPARRGAPAGGDPAAPSSRSGSRGCWRSTRPRGRRPPRASQHAPSGSTPCPGRRAPTS